MTERRAPDLQPRNINFSYGEPVGDWPFEAILTALERGGLSHWRRIAAEIDRDPWGPVSRKVEEALSVARPYGISELMEGLIASARSSAERAEKDEVARQIRTFIAASGLSRADFAVRIGTSVSRLSTYAAGRVSPSAALFLRMQALAAGIGPVATPSPRPGRNAG